MEALLPLIITFGLMWALLIRPQQRRVRQHQELVATLSAGDEVITTGGIVGSIVSVVDDIVTLEVAPDTSIRVLRSAVQSRIAPYDAEEAFEADDELDEYEIADDPVADGDLDDPVADGDLDDPVADGDLDDVADGGLDDKPAGPPSATAPSTGDKA